MILTKAELDAGYSVAWADLDAMGPAAILERLQALGVSDDAIDQRFLYFEPAESLINDVLEDVTGEIIDRGIRLFVIDAFNPMLSLHGLDPSSTPDIETFWREVADPLCRAGAAPTLLDHVPRTPGLRSTPTAANGRHLARSSTSGSGSCTPRRRLADS